MSAFAEIGYRAPASLAPQKRAAAGLCPVQECDGHVPEGCVFCTDHHFQLPTGYARAVLKAKIACERAKRPETRAFLDQQFASFVRSCVTHLGEART